MSKMWTRASRSLLVAGLVSTVASCAAPSGREGDGADAGRRADLQSGDQAVAMLQGGPTRSGALDTTGVERLGRLAWRFETGGAVRSSPVLAGDLLYVGSADGVLYAIERGTGGERWRFDAGSPIVSTPAVSHGTVFFGTRDNRVIALDRATGAARWELDTGPDLPWEWGHEGWDYFTSSPAVVGTTVVIGSGNGSVYALSTATGEQLWRVETGGKVRSSPAVADGVVYVGSADGRVYALDLVTGEEQWSFATDGESMASAEFGWDRKTVSAAPTVGEDTVYVGSRDGNLYALDRASGEERWRFSDGPSWVIASTALADGVVYSGRSDVLLFRAIDAATGEEMWQYDTGGYVYSCPAVVGELVYVGSASRWLYAFERESGEVRWRYRTGGAVYSSPVVADGAVYFGSDDGFVYALVAADGPSPRPAVYWDDGLAARAVYGRSEEHRAVTDYFEEYGYELLDGEALTTFLEERIEDGAPSVVLFAMDELPESVTAPGDETALLRRYLGAAGKAVWLGFPPLALQRDAEGRAVAFDRSSPGRLLGVDHELADADHYSVAVTEAGRAWGLEGRWIGSGAVDPAGVTTVLATDELGRAAAWVKSYGGGEGTGFVKVEHSVERQRLDEIRRVAELGVLRLPDRQR